MVKNSANILQKTALLMRAANVARKNFRKIVAVFLVFVSFSTFCFSQSNATISGKTPVTLSNTATGNNEMRVVPPSNQVKQTPPKNMAEIHLPGFQENQPTAFEQIPSYTPLMDELQKRTKASTGTLPSTSVKSAGGDFSVNADSARNMNIENFAADMTGKSRFLFNDQTLKEPITITGTRASQAIIDGETVYLIDGGCRIRQEKSDLNAPRAVVWEKNNPSPPGAVRQIIVYLESETGEPLPTVEIGGGSVSGTAADRSWIGNLTTASEIRMQFAENVLQTARLPDVYYRARLARLPKSNMSRPYRLMSETAATFSASAPVGGGEDSGVVGLSINSRGDTPMSVQWQQFPEQNQSKVIIEQGVNIVIAGLPRSEFLTGDTIDISADRAVGWMANLENLYKESQATGQKPNIAALDLELYLEGNIIFREGDRVIYADRMYYDVKNAVGKILRAEIYTPVQDYDGVVRVMADSIERTGPDSFSASNTILTPSMMGKPGTTLGSKNMQITERSVPLYDRLTGQPIIDPQTNRQALERRQYIVSEHNMIKLGGAPVFYWPWLAFNAKEPVIYLKKADYYHDNIFGHQIRTRWDLYQLLNIQNRPDGTALDLNLDYLTKRGLGHGAQLTYNRDSFMSSSTPIAGIGDFWGIYDVGEDNLGLGRRDLAPESDYRYRAFWQHKQFFPNDLFGQKWLGNNWVLTAELGTSNDRNFLPQYFEREWETFKDENTGLELKRTWRNQSLSLTADYSLDDFHSHTDSTPRLDHFTIGYSPFSQYFGDYFTWYEHTHLGLESFHTATSPKDLRDAAIFRYREWETAPGSSLDPLLGNVNPLDATREVFATRHEIDMPFNLGPIRCVPYLMGEFAHWGEDRRGGSADRLLGGAGFRANLPFWKVNPNYSSSTLYVNGIAHKVDLGFDFSYAAASESYDNLILYDQPDDNSIEDYRRRYSVTTFNGTIPLLYDERYYAIRSGLGNWVTSPVTELADDLTLTRFYFNQRWQTKRGPVNQRRIVDWITLDAGLNYYPKKEQNFGENLGLLDYNFRWHVGDRFAILSSGLFDTFNSGQTILRLGGILQRPDRGSLYIGADRLEGPFSRTYLNASLSYDMTEKWSAMYSTSYDLDRGRNMGQSLSISRRGETFLVRVGANYDWSRDVWGLSFSLAPAFFSKIKSGPRLNR
jgi:lipopolysaccharide export system protein LptA